MSDLMRDVDALVSPDNLAHQVVERGRVITCDWGVYDAPLPGDGRMLLLGLETVADAPEDDIPIVATTAKVAKLSKDQATQLRDQLTEWIEAA